MASLKIAPSLAYPAIRGCGLRHRGCAPQPGTGREETVVGWMGTKQYFRVTGWSPSTFLTFALPHTLSQGLARDFHPKQGYPACLE